MYDFYFLHCTESDYHTVKSVYLRNRRMKKMKLENFEGYTYVDGGVCAAKGFVANGLNAGINPDKKKKSSISTS